MCSEPLIPPHGGYRDLQSYQMAEIVFDATVVFCDRFIDRRSRTHDQMVQAARSGKQNIAEGSMASGTSKKTELKLIGVARASLEELLLDFQDLSAPERACPSGEKTTRKRKKFERFATAKIGLIRLIRPILKAKPPEIAANTAICLIHQTNYLLDQQLRALEKEFLKEGGFTERLYRSDHRCAKGRNKSYMTNKTYIIRRRSHHDLCPSALCLLRAAVRPDPYRADLG